MKFHDWVKSVESINPEKIINIARSVKDSGYICNPHQIIDCPSIVDKVCESLKENGIKCKKVNGVFQKNEKESFSHTWILVKKHKWILDPTLSQFGIDDVYFSHPNWIKNSSISKSQYIRKKNRKINLGGNFTFQ